jgi:putative serine protease PepD
VKSLLAPVLVAALVGGALASATIMLVGSGARRSSLVARGVPASTLGGSSGTRREAAATRLSATQIYQRDSTGVVGIKAVTAEGQDEGTGIVLNEEGLILTNDHVIKGATSITVDASGSSKLTRSASVVGEEANEDLALIKVDPSGLGLKALTLVSSSSVEVGDAVYAIGNPYGLEETLTRGIVSALGREIAAPDGAKISGAIQTDTALNPGNSGGPLLNEEGDVIGVNSQIASDASTVGGAQPGNTGVGFAIAANTVAQAVKTIESGNGVKSAAAASGQPESEQGGATPEDRRGPSTEAEAEAQGAGGAENRAEAETGGIGGTEAGDEGEGGPSGYGRSEGEMPEVTIR